MKKQLQFSIFGNPDTLRLDAFLSQIFEDKSRNYLQTLITGGKVVLKGGSKKLKKTYCPEPHDCFEIEIEYENLDVLPEDIALDIIYEDENFSLINKDAGINVHPVDGPGGHKGTMVNALLFHVKDLASINGVMRPGIVHRLDKQTSGAILIAKNDKTMQALQEIIAEREITKTYLALVNGTPTKRNAVIESEIGRDRTNRKMMTARNPISPRYAKSEYTVLQSYDTPFGGISLLEVDIYTGRTHQIRVHLRGIGHQIIGDPLYGNKKVNEYFAKKYEINRQFLHAWKLSFELFGTKHDFTAPLKSDLLNLLKEVGEENDFSK